MDKMDDPLRLDAQLCFAIYAASHAFTRFYRPRLEALGVTYPQYLVLLALWEADGVSVGALGRRLHLDSGTLTPLLKRLEAAGSVIRRRDEDDERLVRIFLTGHGQSLRDRALRVPLQMHDAAAMDADGLAAMREQLDTLRQRLEASISPSAPE